MDGDTTAHPLASSVLAAMLFVFAVELPVLASSSRRWEIALVVVALLVVAPIVRLAILLALASAFRRRPPPRWLPRVSAAFGLDASLDDEVVSRAMKARDLRTARSAA